MNVPLLIGLSVIAGVFIVVGTGLDLRVKRAWREWRLGPMERRITAVGDEVEAWPAREADKPQVAVYDPVRGLDEPGVRGGRPLFEPPYVRLRCPGCGNTKDGWVQEDGTLEDPRDYECRSDENLPCFGKSMEVDPDA